jgi:acetylglutamate/LysW-gamma-L-alpha-aminoadipate kinase
LVHGGSAEANRLGEQLSCPPRYLEAADGMRSRYTDAATLDVLTMAMVGRIKPRLVEQLGRLGARAIGLTGLDGRLVTARQTPPVKAIVDGRRSVVRDDHVGRITAINVDLLRLLLGAGYVPVISPPVLDPAIGPLNSDADRLAAALAVALGAEWLITLSNVPGLLRDAADPASLITSLTAADRDAALGFARGRMRVKLQAAYEALEGGVGRVVVGDGRLPQPIHAALRGAGTLLTSCARPEEAVA